MFVLTGAAAGLLLACAGDPAPAERAAPTDPAARAREAAQRFDAARAFGYLKHQVAFGPRVPGTEAHRKTGDWLRDTVAAQGGEVSEFAFQHTDVSGRTWPLRNILARFGPSGGERMLLVAHWDTRPWADRDRAEVRNQPIPGANDGASGVAVLLELAHHLSTAELDRGVDLLFADGEDLGDADSGEGYCAGTRRFVADGHAGSYRAVLVLDMVADVDQRFPVEGYSLAHAPGLVDRVWSRAALLGIREFVREPGPVVYDDHVPFLEAGIPAVDIIDFDYPAWHTLQDDLGAVSPEALERVGQVVLSLILAP